MRIDNGGWQTWSNATGSINLTPVALSAGVHTLQIAQGRDYDYVFSFGGLTLAPGATTSRPTASTNIIEFIGDSLTAGYTDSRSDVSAYAWLCAEKLNCEHTQIAYPGVNLVSGYSGVGQDVQYFNQRSFADTNSGTWNFTNYTARMVVINLGQNDGGANGVPGTVFQSDYTNFLAQIRNRYAAAEIFAMRPFLGFMASQIQAAVDLRHAMGDLKVHYVDTTGWLTNGDYNDGVHPSDLGQIKAANRLKVVLAPYLGGDVVGKVTVGYQGWFSASGDGSPLNAWGHANLEMWPDMREYAVGYTGCPFPQGGVAGTNFNGNLGIGQPATMFCAYDQQVVNTHFRWLAENNIDGAALQRFCNEISPGSTIKAQRDGLALKVRNAATAAGRKFYIEYDASGNSGMNPNIKQDWTNTIINALHLTDSPAYARQYGRPVVGVYGMGYASAPSPGPGSTNDCLDLINFLHAQGCYVMGGTPGQWRNGVGDSTTNFSDVYHALDMISPWAVGRVVDAGFIPFIAADLADCASNGVDYEANVYPGTSFYNSNGSNSPPNQFPRQAGNFLWSQLAGVAAIGAPGVFIAMFDEMNEATPIFKCAADASMTPAGKWFLTLDADGVACDSDFYLRLVKDGGNMIKGTIPYAAVRPTAPVLPAVSPAPPSGFLAVGTNSQMNLTWRAVPGARSYNLRRATMNGGPYTLIATNLGGLAYSDLGLLNGQSYFYVVTSVNTLGESAYSLAAGDIPSQPVISASGESLPGSGAAQAFDGKTNTYWFNANSGNTGWLKYDFGGTSRAVTGYLLTSAGNLPARDPAAWQFQASSNGVDWLTLDTRGGQSFAGRYLALKYLFNNSLNYRYYRLNVTANNGDPAGIQLAELALIYAPTAPAAVTVTPFSSSQLVLGWNPVLAATGYNVKRADNPSGPFSLVASNLQAAYFWDGGLAPATSYYYQIFSVNDAGEGPGTASVGAVTLAVPPTPILDFMAQGGDRQIRLSWQAAANATNYLVRRSNAATGPFVGVGVSTNAFYVDAGLTNGVTCYYTVTAFGSGGVGPAVTPVAAVPRSPNAYTDWMAALQPLGFWWLNETTGTNAADYSNHGFSGVYNSGVILNGVGPNPPHLGFDSVNQAVRFQAATNAYVGLPPLNLNSSTATFTA
ncbi:MAG TPA: GDSL-type esterase/lipase family protein, partial [Verrucomicrobiae bacterium]